LRGSDFSLLVVGLERPGRRYMPPRYAAGFHAGQGQMSPPNVTTCQNSQARPAQPPLNSVSAWVRTGSGAA
jgi:hypothetical protein